jgi:threonine aldolase
MRVIDLRSDTVTKPTREMRQAMATAVVGDDVYQEDPTVFQLERRVASMFHKEAALFFPTGTMANLTAVMAWCPKRASEIIVGHKSHIFLYEQTGACQYGGISMRTVTNLPDGTMDINEIQNSIREEDIHEPETCLICVENTHNACGGKVLPITFLHRLKQLCDTQSPNKIPIHIDGARLWNAITAMDCTPVDIAKYADSVTVCLSKGLGCPAGSLLVGSKELIQKARRIRKSLGGGMRQTGILAAAGLVALDDFERGVLRDDHRKAAELVRGISDIPNFEPYNPIETNIVFIKIHPLCLPPNPNSQSILQRIRDVTADTMVEKMKEKGVFISAWAPDLIRLVFHRDLNDEDVSIIINGFRDIYYQMIYDLMNA